ncbi:DUF397 domain-containing protein [Streptomyces sp. NPDC079020]|uniref:DUF397 domain-containing protein n=1 Tax=Streptomyces sp. NPDC079020 TaxID=3365722 RepID=UPI0037D82C2D
MSDRPLPDELRWIRAAPEGEPEGPGPWIEVAEGQGGDLIHLRETSDPATVVTTTRTKWEAFVKGVLAGEFDHFAEIGADSDTGSRTGMGGGSETGSDTERPTARPPDPEDPEGPEGPKS